MNLVLDIKSVLVGAVLGGFLIVFRAALSVAKDKITNKE